MTVRKLRLEAGAFERVANFRALRAAALRAARGKRKSPSAAAFLADLETECLRLERELQSGSWRPGPYVAFEIREPKPRMVSAAAFRDRVVHHALCEVMAPVFERGFIFDSFANREGKGTHAAIDRYERFSRASAHVLRCDIFRYFPAIDHRILKRDLRRRLSDERLLAIVDAIIDGSNPQEPVEVFFPGDDLFAPIERRRGLPIGNLTSQTFANIYLDPLDHFVKEVLRAKRYVRYVDDFALFHDDVEVLRNMQERIAAFLVGRRLLLHPRKTFIVPTAASAQFLGIVLRGDGGRRLPEDNVARFAGRFRAMRARVAAGVARASDFEPNLASWSAHAAHGHAHRLRETLFRGWPPSEPRKPEGPNSPPGRCAAVRGTMIPGTSAPRSATATAPAIATTTSASGSPVRSRQARTAAFKDVAGAPGSVQGLHDRKAPARRWP